MPLTQDEQLVANSKAHLQSIQGELGVATAFLSDVLNDIENAKTTLAYIRLCVDDETSMLESIQDRQVGLVEDHNAKTADLAKRESAFVVAQQEFEDYKSKELAVIANAKIKAQEEAVEVMSAMSRLSLAMRESQDTLDALNNHISTLETERSTVAASIKEARKELQDLDDARAAGAEDHTFMRKAIAQTKEELIKAQAALEEEKKKLSSPVAALEAEKVRVARRERDTEIIRKRLKRFHETMFPGQPISL